MPKEYIGIRLSPDLLKWIDENIDGVRVRNRSHFIEIILNEAMTQKIKSKK